MQESLTVFVGGLGSTVEDDLSLAHRCASDRSARESLYKMHSAYVYRLARRIVCSQADAEDVLQEVFIQCFKSIHSYRGEATLRTWLNRLTVRACWRHLRRHRKRQELRLTVVQEVPSPTSWDAAAEVDSRASLSALYRLLDKVSPKRRVVFILHHVEGHPLREVAALIGVSTTAAKKLVWRARRDIQRLAPQYPALASLFSARSAGVLT